MATSLYISVSSKYAMVEIRNMDNDNEMASENSSIITDINKLGKYIMPHIRTMDITRKIVLLWFNGHVATVHLLYNKTNV